MKKTIILLLAAALLVGTTGCNNPGVASTDTSVVSGEGGSAGNVSSSEGIMVSAEPKDYSSFASKEEGMTTSEEYAELKMLQDKLAPKMKEWRIDLIGIRDGKLHVRIIVGDGKLSDEKKKQITDFLDEDERIVFETTRNGAIPY